MWQGIKDFFSNAWTQWGIFIASVGGALAYFFSVNDFSRPPLPDRDKPQDFSGQLNKLDPSKPVGVFVFNVHHKDITNYGVNAARNNYIEKMHEHYGDNFVVIDNPTNVHLAEFANDFNKHFVGKNPEVHFVANHHQGTYDDRVLATFFKHVEAKHKRALVLACGPESSAYINAGCDYVMIPAPDKQGLGIELSLEISPAYRDAIGWLAESKTKEEAEKKFSERSFYNVTQEWNHQFGSWINSVTGANPEHLSHTYKPPIVVSPPTNIPIQPVQKLDNSR